MFLKVVDPLSACAWHEDLPTKRGGAGMLTKQTVYRYNNGNTLLLARALLKCRYSLLKTRTPDVDLVPSVR